MYSFFQYVEGGKCKTCRLYAFVANGCPSAFEQMTKRKLILKTPMLVEKFGALPDDPSVDQRAEYRSQLDTLEVPKPEKGKGEENAQKTADAVISCFEFMDVDTHARRYLFDKQLIRLGRDIRMKEKGYADRAKEHADQIKQNAHDDRF